MKKIEFFDAHTHIQIAGFKEDYREVIARALEAGIGMVNVGIQKDTSQKAIALAHEYEYSPIYATVGLHPCHVTPSGFHDAQELENDEVSDGTFDYEYYKNLAHDSRVIAIGECGLDYFRMTNDKSFVPKQHEVLLQQIKLAHEVQKPLMIHCRSGIPERASPHKAGRDAFPDLIRILYTERTKLKKDHPGIIHFFTGTKNDAEQLLHLGFSFTFGGAITYLYKKGEKEGVRDEVIRAIPLDRILSETDAPYVAPVPYRGKRNEHLYVQEVVRKIAEIRGISVEKTASQLVKNAEDIFGIKL